MYWPEDDVEQLFDLKNDPREENDLASDPAHAKKLAEMRKRFTGVEGGGEMIIQHFAGRLDM